LNQSPVGVNVLAKKANVAPASVSQYFKKKFGNHAKYRAACRKPGELAFSLKLIRDELSPKDVLDPSLLNKIAAQNSGE
jgi:hypothetical protein